MFNWIKRFLGFIENKNEPLVLTDPIKYRNEGKSQEEPTDPTPKKTKKKKTKKNPKKSVRQKTRCQSKC
jgi:FtsZ-interacting cell division protein YlmF